MGASLTGNGNIPNITNITNITDDYSKSYSIKPEGFQRPSTYTPLVIAKHDLRHCEYRAWMFP
jgi:hypothetical protein